MLTQSKQASLKGTGAVAVFLAFPAPLFLNSVLLIVCVRTETPLGIRMPLERLTSMMQPCSSVAVTMGNSVKGHNALGLLK